MGTYSTFTTVSRSDTSYMGGDGQCYFHLYSYEIVDTPDPEPDPEPTLPENAVKKTLVFDDAFNSGFTTINTETWVKTVEDIEIEVLKNSGSDIACGESNDSADKSFLRYADPIRIYKNHTISFTAPEGFEIYAITDVDSPSGDNAFVDTNVSATVANGTATVNSDSVSLTETNTVVTLTALNQFRIYSLVVVLVPVEA